MAQICPECKTSNSDGATLCKQCGTPLPGVVADNAASNGVPKAAVPAGGATPAQRKQSGAIAEAARRAAAKERAAQQAANTTPGTTATGATRQRGTTTTGAATTPARRPGAAPVGPVSNRINKALDEAGLPRFSTQRYLVIWVGALVLILGTLALLVFLGANDTRVAAPTPLPGANTTGNYASVEMITGTFTIQLTDDAKMTQTVKNFKDKVASGFYNGLTFHRVEPFVVQGGDPKGDGSGGGSIIAEYNDTPFVAGSLGMASQGPHADRVNDAQFFITKTDAPSYKSNYPNFGKVVAGMDVVNSIKVGDKITKITLSDTLEEK